MNRIDTDLIIPQSHANIIWRAAWLSLISILHATYYSQTSFAVMSAGVTFTSLNYWRNPVRNSWRRYIDIGYVNLGLAYQLVLAYNMTDSYYRQLYYKCTMTSAMCYVIGYLLMWSNMPRASVYAHAAIHVVSNLGIIALQRGAHPLITVPNGFANREPGDV
jgi:hypothetical protein